MKLKKRGKFTKTENRIIQFLQEYNKVITREELFKEIFKSEFYNYRLIDVHINRIRKKINDKNKQIIKTVRGIGYKWNLKDKKEN